MIFGEVNIVGEYRLDKQIFRVISDLTVVYLLLKRIILERMEMISFKVDFI